MYAIFSLEKVWQSHDFMHIFSIHPSQKLSQCRASDVKVTAKAWTLWGWNYRSDVDLNIDVDLPKSMFGPFAKFSLRLFSNQSLLFLIFVFFFFRQPTVRRLKLQDLGQIYTFFWNQQVLCSQGVGKQICRKRAPDLYWFITYFLIGPLCLVSFLKFCLQLSNILRLNVCWDSMQQLSTLDSLKQ